MDDFINEIFYGRFSPGLALLIFPFVIFFPITYLIYRCYHGLKKDN